MKRFCTMLFLMMAVGCHAQILQKGIKINYGLNSFLTQMDVKNWKSEIRPMILKRANNRCEMGECLEAVSSAGSVLRNQQLAKQPE